MRELDYASMEEQKLNAKTVTEVKFVSMIRESQLAKNANDRKYVVMVIINIVVECVGSATVVMERQRGPVLIVMDLDYVNQGYCPIIQVVQHVAIEN